MRKRLEIRQNARKPRIRTLGNTQCEQMLLSAVVSQLDKAAASLIKKLIHCATLWTDGKQAIHNFLLSKK